MKKNQMKLKDLFNLEHTIAEQFLEKYEYGWEVLPNIGSIIREIGAVLPENEYKKIGHNIWIHNSVKVPPTACIAGPLLICEGASIRHCAFFRGNVIVGKKAVVGNSTELKNVILFDKVQVPHYNYVGDSILGYEAHMGASSLTSNVKSDKTLVSVHAEDGDIETGLKKFGALLGDHVEVGCGAVLNPGTVIGKESIIYPLSSVRGCVEEMSVYKAQDSIVKRNVTVQEGASS